MGPLAISVPAPGPLVPAAAGWVRAPKTPVTPWDRLCTDQRLSDRSGPARDYLDRVHRIIFCTLAGEFDCGVRRLLRMGIGLPLASYAVQIMNFLFG